MDRGAFLRNCVRTCIADDYENFETIMASVHAWAGLRRIKPDRDEIVEALENIIATGEADAYRLSPNPGKPETVSYGRDHLEDLWFYLSPTGKLNVLSVSELTGNNPETVY